MKDGCAVVHNEKRKEGEGEERKNNVSFWLGFNVKGNGLPLMADLPLWISRSGAVEAPAVF